MRLFFYTTKKTNIDVINFILPIAHFVEKHSISVFYFISKINKNVTQKCLNEVQVYNRIYA